MRVQLVLFLIIFSSVAFSSEDAEVRDLFSRYQRVVSGHETHLVEEVFSEKFLKENGGKSEFVEKVKSEPKVADKSIPVPQITWKKALKGESILAKLKPITTNKEKFKKIENGSEFVIVKENGKLKIDGTVGDAE